MQEAKNSVLEKKLGQCLEELKNERVKNAELESENKRMRGCLEAVTGGTKEDV